MKIEATGDQWIFNGVLEWIPDAMLGRKLEDPVVYEVIRVKAGRPVFLKAHLDRLKASLMTFYSGAALPEWVSQLEEHFIKLVHAEEIINQNIRIIVWNMGHESCSWCMFPIKSYYPATSVYEAGVNVATLKSERANPHAKVYHDALIKTVTAMRNETDIFEVLLIDRNGFLTEGSRSNLFFVKGNVVYSAPDEAVLHGITREKLKAVLAQMGVECVQMPIDAEGIDAFDGAFLTGTSIHVLPVHAIDQMTFRSSENETIRRIMKAFELAIEKDHQNL